MKLRFGWGPLDGAEGMQRNVDLVRTVTYDQDHDLTTKTDRRFLLDDLLQGIVRTVARRNLPKSWCGLNVETSAATKRNNCLVQGITA